MDPEQPSYISYEEFGRRFLEYAVSEQRIAAAFGELTGAAFDFGPIGVGPGRLAKVIDIAEPRAGDVRVNVASATKRGQLLRVLASVDHEIRKPEIAAVRNIDVATRLDAAWKL
ncbi:hypothetical protein [Nocardia sp. MW-W600-9]